MIIGTNFDILRSDWPSSYVLRHIDSAISDAHALKHHLKPHLGKLRTLLWFAERDRIPSELLHIPLTQEDADAINRFSKDCPLPVEYSIGPLWEALWMSDNPAWKPDNPFANAQELAEAFKQSLDMLHPTMQALDIYNEFDQSYDFKEEDPVMASWYPYALAWCRKNKVRATVSVIVDTNGSCVRAGASYRWLQANGGLPDFIELHPNGIEQNAWPFFVSEVDRLRSIFGLPITVGECGVDPPSFIDWESVGKCGLEEFIIWPNTL